jgi:hypothetical protein
MPLPEEIQISCLAGYVASAFVGALLIRIVLSATRAYQAVFARANQRVTYGKAFLKYMGGLDPLRDALPRKDDQLHDRGEYGVSFLLGWAELIIFPVLIVMGLHLFVGSWIGLKIASIYFRWQSDRFLFNLFLLGNAGILAASWVLTCFVTRPAT